MNPLSYLVEERPMQKPKDTIFYQQMLTKSPTGVWETSEQQFQRELKEGKWVLLGYKKSYRAYRQYRRPVLDLKRPRAKVDRVIGGWYKEYYDGHHTYYTRDPITKEEYTGQEWENMCSWNPDLKKY